MPYTFIEIEFATPDQLFDLIRPIDIHNELLSVVDVRYVQGSNFNKYYLPPDIPRPRIDFRLKLSDRSLETAILAKAQELRTAGRISASSESFRLWIEPDFVVKAHESATASAVRFKEEIQQGNLLMDYQSNQVEFLGYFTRELFKQAGGEFYIAWTFLRNQTPSHVVNLTQPCAEIIARVPAEYRHNPDFIERYVHCFLNNVANSQVEEKLVNFAIVSSIWKNIAGSWQTL